MCNYSRLSLQLSLGNLSVEQKTKIEGQSFQLRINHSLSIKEFDLQLHDLRKLDLLHNRDMYI